MSGFWESVYTDFDLAAGPTWRADVAVAYMLPGAPDSANDLSPNENHGSIVGSVAFVDGRYGRAFQFSGGHILCSQVLPIRPDAKSVVALVVANNNGYVFGQTPASESSGEAFRVRARNHSSGNGPLDAPRIEAEGGYKVGSTPLASGQAASLAVVSPEGATSIGDTQLYLNGALETQGGLAERTWSPQAASLRIGSDAGNPEQLNGRVESFVVYSSALTANEAAAFHAGPEPTPLAADTLGTDGTFGGATFDGHNNGAVTITRDLLRDGQVIAANVSSPVSFDQAGDYQVVARASNDGGNSPIMDVASNVVTHAAAQPATTHRPISNKQLLAAGLI